MTRPVRISVLLLAVICPFYVATLGACCDGTCADDNDPCTWAAFCKTDGIPCPDLEIESNPTGASYNGVACTKASGGSGQCLDGTCQTMCQGDLSTYFVECEHPVGGGSSGVCIDGQCVPAAPADPCAIPGIGRINCCTPQGCVNASGSRCGDADGDGDNEVILSGACDPTEVLPTGQGAGTCNNGVCTIGLCHGNQIGIDSDGVALYGLCNDGLDCTKDSCAPSTGACSAWNVDGTPTCSKSATETGKCVEQICTSGAAPCDEFCVSDNPCYVGKCDRSKLINGQCPDRSCCTFTISVGAPCEVQGQTGVCDTSGSCFQMCSAN